MTLVAYLAGALGGFVAGVAALVFVGLNMDIRSRTRRRDAMQRAFLDG